MKNKIITGLFLAVIALLVMSNGSGIANRNAGPGETACNASGCHTGFALNSGGGSVTITDNIPATGYIPGQTYTINVTVAKTGVGKFGFGFEAVNISNGTAGTLSVTNSASTHTLNGTRVNIVHQNNGGISSNSKTFTFNWIAPSVPNGTITFYAAGNAANGNNSDSGDYIYTTSKSFGPSPLITGTVTGGPFCGGSTGINIPFYASGTFNTGNVFTAELSDASGNFSSPTALGSVTATASGTITSTLPLPNIAGTAYRIRVVSTLPALIGLDNGVNLSIQAAASTANAGANQSVCGFTASLQGNAPSVGTGSWSVLSGGATIVSATNPTTTATNLGTGTNVFRWTISNGSCASSISHVTVTSFAAPSTASAGVDQTVCANYVNLLANNPLAGSGSWSLVSGSANITSNTSFSTNATGLSTGLNVFTWKIANGPCAVSVDTLKITFSGSITIANAGSDQTVCANSATLSANPALIGTGSWSLVNGSGTFASITSESTTVSGLALGDNVFRWIISNGVCSPSTDDITIRSVTISPAVVGASQTLCATNTSISATPPSNGIGTWQVVAGTSSLSSLNSPSASVTALSPGLNSFVWTVANAPCVANSATLDIVQSGTIDIADAGQDQSVCAKNSNLNATQVNIGTGSWSVISGSGIFSNVNSPFSAVSNLALGNNVLRWTVSNGTCATVYDDLSLSTATISVANAGSSQTICNTTSFLQASIPTFGTGTWSLLSGTATIQNSTSYFTPISGLGYGVNIFRWTVSNAPCPSSVSDVTLSNCTTNGIVTSGLIGSPFCQSTSYSLLVSFSTTGVFTGFYTAQLSDATGSFSNPVAIGSGPSSPISAYIPANTAGGNGYRIRVVCSAPPTLGVPNTTNLEINNCNPDYLKLDSVFGGPFCANTSLQMNIPFVVGGNVSPAYIAELSDLSGSFADPITVGYAYSSPITAVLPDGLPTGFNYKVRIKSTQSGIYSNISLNNLSINTCEITGLMDLRNSKLNFYPSLILNEFFVENVSDFNSVQLQLFDVTGKLVKQCSLSNSANQKTKVTVTELPASIYFLRIVAGDEVLNGKLIKMQD